jgi:2-methylcitrate dehydratase PrpD
MATSSQELGEFAAGLRFENIPTAVVERAKDCIIDTIGTCAFGSQFEWSRMVADYAGKYGSGGMCTVFGRPDQRFHAPYAALANGVFAHAFEQDSVRDPGAGAHPGATLLPPLLAACEDHGADGKTAIAAFVAGCEVMFRIAVASHHSPEKIGFHSPGLTGCYGAEIAAGRVFALDGAQLTNALGIAGSLSSGLLAFTKSKQGAMIKRLHLGRASESGILAARLAGAGYAGPETVLEGKFGFLDAYCGDYGSDPALLTAGLGQTWETLRICLKRYACHINAHTPVQSMRELMSEHAFSAEDVAHVRVEGSNGCSRITILMSPATSCRHSTACRSAWRSPCIAIPTIRSRSARVRSPIRRYVPRAARSSSFSAKNRATRCAARA